jgi:hypothetical protein
MIRDDIALSQALFKAADAHPELQAVTQNLSITTFRFIPLNMAGDAAAETYLNKLNEELESALLVALCDTPLRVCHLSDYVCRAPGVA